MNRSRLLWAVRMPSAAWSGSGVIVEQVINWDHNEVTNLAVSFRNRHCLGGRRQLLFDQNLNSC